MQIQMSASIDCIPYFLYERDQAQSTEAISLNLHQPVGGRIGTSNPMRLRQVEPA